MDLHGIGVGRGVAVGPILRMPDPLPEPPDSPRKADAAAELATVTSALATVATELLARGEKAGGTARDVLEAASLMAQDPTLVDDVTARIESGKTGERAVFEAFGAFQDMLTGMGGLMAERATDLGDVSQRIIASLRGVTAPGVPSSDTPFILVAPDLAPADTALLDLDKVLGLITRDGGPTSHTAILARSKSIPAIVGVTGALDLTDGTVVIADAATGSVRVSPSEGEVAEARKRIADRAAAASAPITDGMLADGTKVPLLRSRSGQRGSASFAPNSCSSTRSARPPWRSSGCNTPSCSRTSPAGRSWCARSMPGPTSRSASSTMPTRRTRPSGSVACVPSGRASRSCATSSPPSCSPKPRRRQSSG